MRRTQLYLDDGLWQALHSHASLQKTTISELVRQAVRQVYSRDMSGRTEAMQAFAGMRKKSSRVPDSTEYIRGLRRGSRFERLSKP